jgi:hypothetical protein
MELESRQTGLCSQNEDDEEGGSWNCCWDCDNCKM